jgi:hypothetical protein
MHKFNRFIRVLSFAVIIFTLIVALIPVPALAKGKAGKVNKRNKVQTAAVTEVQLIVPGDQETCKPEDVIKTTGVADDAKVYYAFFIVQTTGMQKIKDGWVTGNLNMPFPYPAIDGTMTFAASIMVTDPSGAMVKLGKKWTVTCKDAPPPPPPPPPGGGQGCTPGYWRQSQHYDSWVGFVPAQNFEAVFGVDASFNPTSLGFAVQLGGGGELALARHAVAALLNASNSGVSYMYSTAQVIAMVQQAYATGNFQTIKNLFEAQNEMGCPLN